MAEKALQGQMVIGTRILPTFTLIPPTAQMTTMRPLTGMDMANKPVTMDFGEPEKELVEHKF